MFVHAVDAEAKHRDFHEGWGRQSDAAATIISADIATFEFIGDWHNHHRFKCIGDVRGLGAMVAMELIHDATRQEPAGDITKALVAKAAGNGLVLLSCGHNSNVIRMLAPLTTSVGMTRSPNRSELPQ